MIRKLNSIAGRTMFIFVGVFLVILLPVNTLIFQRIRSALEDSELRELKVEADLLLEKVNLDPLSIPLPRPGQSVLLQSRYLDHTDVLFSSPEFPISTGQFLTLEGNHLDSFAVVSTHRLAGNGELVLSLARSNAFVEGRIAEIRNYMWIANGVSIGLACLLVFLITSYTTKPIDNIIRATQGINASRAMGRVPVPATQNETRALAETINDMLRRLEASIQQQTNFFASAAHELKTPLSVMKIELVDARDHAADVPSRDILNSCLQEVDRLSRIIHSFLLVSQLKSESLKIRKAEVAINEILYAALRKSRFLIEERKASMQVKLDEQTDHFNLTGDADLLETVFVNLIENALQHSPLQSTVNISLTGKEGGLVVEITNPIDEPILFPEQLVQEFRKVKSFSPGFGMGLWICDQVMTMHGGRLQLRADDQNHFVVRLSWLRS